LGRQPRDALAHHVLLYNEAILTLGLTSSTLARAAGEAFVKYFTTSLGRV